MHYTKIVTSFLKNKEQILILKRSQNVKSMKGLWGGISGIIENNEPPLERAKTEIFEEVGITEDKTNLLKSANPIDVISPQYGNHKWHIFPFLFQVNDIKINLNWENSDFQWIERNELKKFETVPNLDKVLKTLI